MIDPLILVLDEGTTSTRAMLFGQDGALHGVAQQELTQHYPQSGWVEHDAAEIWDKTLACARDMVEQAGGADHVAAIGITNQRETVVAWDKATGEPLTRAIVWQDRRTAAFCAELKAAGHEDTVRDKTGLLLDPYFSGTKMRWMLDNVPAIRAAADAGTLALGTVESWLVWKLSGGAHHVTDASNASRTLLLALEGGQWDADLCDLLGVPVTALPEVIDCAGELAHADPELLGAAIPVCGMAGDQQAATIGQGCLDPGQTKATYGTGAFVLANTGTHVPASQNRLLGTVLYQVHGERHYAIEGAVFVAGSLIKYLRDTLGLIEAAEETEELARSIDSSGGVVVVPALSGLGAPHWRPEARGIISGLGFDTGRAHIARAALEAMAHQTRDLAQAYAADGAQWTGLRIDGGMAVNDWMAQDIANLLGLPVTRPDFVETTALGAAMLAAVGCGMHGSLKDAAETMIGATQRFEPAMADSVRAERLARWDAAIAKV
ncbi:glycerol kinase GlpK [Aurantiacibacter gilvus]|uniref:Glycerol kinase GlpK n=1 Tax=Aurantiacibacter gilvus TaxID=3139141 RepID=A0ABU9IA96_9SPHN